MNYSVILFIAIVLVFFVIKLYLSGGFYGGERVCGDGTAYGECSLRQPYFCERGVLLENASVCECPEILAVNGSSCLSKYQTEPKNVTLKYILRGNEKEIKIIAYNGMVDYLSELPRTIHYSDGEEPSHEDFKLTRINELNQREFLLELLTRIQNAADSREDQMRIAVSIVQNIPFGQSEKVTGLDSLFGINYTRYPYEVLYDNEGVCGEKSELLAFLLREMGYGVIFFYHQPENHESIGIKCPEKFSLDNTGYCFIETTGPSIITDNEIEYVGSGKLYSNPEIIFISDGDSLRDDLYEYNDAKDLIELRNNGVTMFTIGKLRRLRDKYGLVDIYRVVWKELFFISKQP